jgi:dihydroorotase
MPAALKEHERLRRRLLHRPAALELYAEAFDAAGALDRLEGFASFHGPDFYGLPRNTGTVTLRRERGCCPRQLPFGDATIKPLRAGETLNWRLQPG